MSLQEDGLAGGVLDRTRGCRDHVAVAVQSASGELLERQEEGSSPMKVVPPYRVAHTYTQRLKGCPEQVFPLLCPVRECDWVNGWDPFLVVSASGVAEVDCVFTMGAEGEESTWVITAYEPPSHIEFLKVTPGETVGRITIDLRSLGDQDSSAEVTYAYTALSPRGKEVIDGFTAAFYQAFMREWEAELNHFLCTGQKLPRQGTGARVHSGNAPPPPAPAPRQRAP